MDVRRNYQPTSCLNTKLGLVSQGSRVRMEWQRRAIITIVGINSCLYIPIYYNVQGLVV